jgi:hypothetical protein
LDRLSSIADRRLADARPEGNRPKNRNIVTDTYTLISEVCLVRGGLAKRAPPAVKHRIFMTEVVRVRTGKATEWNDDAGRGPESWGPAPECDRAAARKIYALWLPELFDGLIELAHSTVKCNG